MPPIPFIEFKALELVGAPSKAMGGRVRRFGWLERQAALICQLAFYLLVFPSAACGLGVEDTEFYGLVEADKVLTIVFVEGPQPWSKHAPIYGSANVSPFSFCWKETVDGARHSFACTANRGSEPNVAYGVLGSPAQAPQYDAKTPAGEAYRSISRKANLGNGNWRGQGRLEAIYECRIGCRRGLPRYIFEVAKYD